MTEKKTDVPGIYKTSEGVLINKDNASLKAYKSQKQKANKIIALEKQVGDLKNDMEDIKNLLTALLSKK